MLRCRWNQRTSTPQIEVEVEWAPAPSGLRYRPSWEPFDNLLPALQRDRKTQALIAELQAQPCVVDKVLDARIAAASECYEYLVTWKGFPLTQASGEAADKIFTEADEAAQWWGEAAIEKEEIRKGGGGEWWLLLRWETEGTHAHKVWYHSSDVEQQFPLLLQQWGEKAAERRKAQVWECGGSFTEDFTLPLDVQRDALQPTWLQVSQQYNSMLWDLYLECIKSDCTRNPQFRITLPEYVFLRWLASCGGDLMVKLVVKFVIQNEEEDESDTRVDVQEGDSAPQVQAHRLAPGQVVDVDGLVAFLHHNRQSNHPAAQQSTAQLSNQPNAPQSVAKIKVWKQVHYIEWPSIRAATTLMGGHNPHKPVAVKVQSNSMSWKWYRVTMGEIRAEYDGNCLTWTSFPIEAYQSKLTGNRCTCDFAHPIMTTTKRRRVDPSSK